jgi:hypothetical protein
VNPPERRSESARRETDVQLAELATAFAELVNDVRELKALMLDRYGPRIRGLEEWRVALAATEQERNVISKRDFRIAMISLILTMLGIAIALGGLILSHA